MKQKHSQITFPSLLTTCLLSTSLTLAVSTTAFAQDDELGDEAAWAAEETAIESATTSETPAGSTDSEFYKLAISTSFPTGGDTSRAHVLYGLEANIYLNLAVGVSLSKGEGVPVDPTDPMSPVVGGDTTLGVDLGVGYRMYKDSKGKIRPYLEPRGRFVVSNFSEFGDTFALAAGAVLGVDYALLDQFTVGVGIGGDVVFSNSFKNINLGMSTTQINATFWW